MYDCARCSASLTACELRHCAEQRFGKLFKSGVDADLGVLAAWFRACAGSVYCTMWCLPRSMLTSLIIEVSLLDEFHQFVLSHNTFEVSQGKRGSMLYCPPPHSCSYGDLDILELGA